MNENMLRNLDLFSKWCDDHKEEIESAFPKDSEKCAAHAVCVEVQRGECDGKCRSTVILLLAQIRDLLSNR